MTEEGDCVAHNKSLSQVVEEVDEGISSLMCQVLDASGNRQQSHFLGKVGGRFPCMCGNLNANEEEGVRGPFDRHAEVPHSITIDVVPKGIGPNVEDDGDDHNDDRAPHH